MIFVVLPVFFMNNTGEMTVIGGCPKKPDIGSLDKPK